MKIFGADDKLVITMEGAEIFWSLKRRIEVPKPLIAKIEFFAERPQKNFAWPFIKFPGSVLPGILLAGNFIKRGERDFWYLRVQHPGVLSIITKRGSFIYDRILFSCTPEIAEQVMTWWKEH